MTRLAVLGLFVCSALVAAAPASAWAATDPRADVVVAATDAPLADWIIPVADTDELEGPSPSERHDDRELSGKDREQSGKDDDGLGDLDDREYDGSDIDAEMARTQREARRNRAYMGEGGAVPRGRGRGRDLAY